MSFLSKLVRRRRQAVEPIEVVPEDDLENRIVEAKRQNEYAVSRFVAATNRNEYNSNLARQIIHDVLARIETKVPNHAGNKK